jgi:hypothetical protein
MTLTTPQNHHKVYLVSLLLLAIGLPLSHALMSIAQIILLGNWIIEGELKQKFRNFFSNPPALIVSGVFIIHLIGLAYSSDLNYGSEDIRKKIPLILLPLILSTTRKIEEKEMRLILKVFIASVFAGTIISFGIYLGLTGTEISDVRQISVFISHIRFSLMIALSMLFCLKLMQRAEKMQKLYYTLLILWFLIFLIILESLTGLFILAATGFPVAFFSLRNTSAFKRRIGYALLITALLVPTAFIAHEVKNFYTIETIVPEKLEKFTARGEPYEHELTDKEVENGRYVRIYIAREELKQAWNDRSILDFDSLDKRGHLLEYTVYRYLTSKGLRKDAEGLSSLNPGEIADIENGVANPDYKYSDIRSRIKQVIWEIDRYFKDYNPSGHSVSMRLEFWKTAVQIVRKNFWFGVGTGDVVKAFEKEYLLNNTPLDKEYRHRSHNQFLALATALGVIGLLYFLFSLTAPFIFLSQSRSFFYITFFFVAALSMFTEDTLETQAGVTFFAFFNSMFLFGSKAEK